TPADGEMTRWEAGPQNAFRQTPKTLIAPDAALFGLIEIFVDPLAGRRGHLFGQSPAVEPADLGDLVVGLALELMGEARRHVKGHVVAIGHRAGIVVEPEQFHLPGDAIAGLFQRLAPRRRLERLARPDAAAGKLPAGHIGM